MSAAEVIWHDVECGAYGADLPLWEELADETGGPVLDLGCGTGRVALHLARRGHTVLGLDREAVLLAALAERAEGLPAEAELGDAAAFALGARFSLALAPMQLLQLLDAEQRTDCLRCVASHLRPGGLAAAAIVADPPPAARSPFVADSATKGERALPLPDTREIDGWIYSSLPLEGGLDDGAIVVRRLRQTVSPSGELDEQIDEVRLHRIDGTTVEGEARAAGLRPAGRREIPATAEHVGSTVVLLRREVA
ncbi:MAG TPA: class I SAM-dependent methyltransferase [Solirubrobacterales bacterium]|nr:class I SAM-dependent methyltransferase [Solirubrobacterales bacterium]